MKAVNLFLTFFKLGLTSFGGPIGAIVLMQKEIQEKRNWVTQRDFEKSFFIAKLLPGPTATQVAVRLGYLINGRGFGIISGIAFILPAFLIILLFSNYLFSYSGNPRIEHVFTGLRLGALVVIATSVIGLARPWVKKIHAWPIFLFSLPILIFSQRSEPLLILGFGLILTSRIAKKIKLYDGATLLLIFWICFKSSFLVFGTGLAIVPLLENEFVGLYHWVTHEEFLNGLVAGQITPGPVLITATYLGAKTAGFAGAVMATVGSFLPSFLIALILVPWMEKRFAETWEKRGSQFLNGAMPVILSGLFVSIIQLGAGFNWKSPQLLFSGVFAFLAQIKFPAWLTIVLTGLLFQVIQTI
ncbi:MAG: chromate transporter [Xanthomonadaceae bacterium]|nr:chromate transporter [Xanthomonadaceae bacterium]